MVELPPNLQTEESGPSLSLENSSTSCSKQEESCSPRVGGFWPWESLLSRILSGSRLEPWLEPLTLPAGAPWIFHFFDFFDFLAECFASKTSVASVPARERSVQGIHRCRVSPSTSLNHTYMILFGEVGIYAVSRNCASSGALLFAVDDVDARLLPKRSLTLLTALIRLGSKQVAMAPLPKAYQYGTLPRLHAVRLLELRVWVGVAFV